MYRTAQSTRATLSRVVRQQCFAQQRNFIRPTAALRADFVQDLYLKELKAYKVPQPKANDAEGHVHKFSPPKTPQSPEESNIANDLKAYEDQAVEVEDASAASTTGEPTEDSFEEWFEDEPEEEETKGASH